MKPKVLALFMMVTGLAGAVWAQQTDDYDPTRGVARISVINGEVSVRRGDSGDWVAAAVNAPLEATDSIYAGPNARAEVQLDAANVVRIAPESEVRFSDLESGRYQLQVGRGVLTFSVLRDSSAQVEICTPSVSVKPTRKGVYRVEVKDDGTSVITVRSGEAGIDTPRGSERLQSGRAMMARGSSSDPEYQLVAASPSDEWDQWNAQRDRAVERTTSYRYMNPDIEGGADLDPYGAWVDSGVYGPVWCPRVSPGWAPYSLGHWVWIDWYGWTWVSDDPWGWAPYHYGRWFMNPGYGWCWYPRGYGRPYWRPALVAFFGFGGGVGVGFGFGNVGWVPLAPYEPFHAWYGRGYYGGYRNSVLTNVNIANSYRNARVNNGITAVAASNFGRGGAASFMRMSGSEVRQAQLVRGQVPIAPTRDSLRLGSRDAQVPRGANSMASQRFFSRNQPANVQRMSFAQQQRGVEQMAQRTFGTSAASEQSRGGWRRVGEPTSGGSAASERVGRANTPAAQNNGGWQRFGGGGRSAQQAPGSGNAGRANQRNGYGQSGSGAAPPRGNSGGGWQQYGGSQTNPARTERSQPPARNDAVRPSNFAPEGQRWFGAGGEPVRINPSIVRERPTSGSGAHSGRGSHGGSSGGGHSRSR